MQIGDVLAQGRLIFFGDEQVVGVLFFHQVASRLLLGVQGSWATFTT